MWIWRKVAKQQFIMNSQQDRRIWIFGGCGKGGLVKWQLVLVSSKCDFGDIITIKNDEDHVVHVTHCNWSPALKDGNGDDNRWG